MARKKSDITTSPFDFGSASGDISVPGTKDAGTNVPGSKDAGTKQKDAGIISGKSFGFAKSRKQLAEDPNGEAQSSSLFSHGKKTDDLGPQYGYDHSIFGHSNEVSAYTAQMQARYAMDPRKKTLIVMGLLVLVLVLLFSILPVGWLTEDGIKNGLAGWLDGFQSNLRALSNLFSGIEDGNGLRILIWQTLAVALVGAALAVNGAVYQGALKNALASPSTLGVMSGGTLGSIIYILLFGVVDEMPVGGVTFVTSAELSAELKSMSVFDYVLATQGRELFAVAGCFAVVGLVLLIAYIAGRGKVSKAALVIAGQVFAAVISGVVSIIRTYVTNFGTEEQIAAMRNTVNGSVSNIMGPLQFFMIAVPLILGFIFIMCMRSRLNLLAFNDDEARSMGISVAKTRNSVVIVCTIMTAVVVSFCGNVGFVGFLVPHLARKIVGPDLRFLLPASALLGSIYLLLSNHAMHLGNFLSGSLGSFTSIIGTVFFLYAIVQQRRRGNVDWI